MADPVKQTLAELRQRGAPDFFERDPAALKAALTAEFERLSNRKLYPAQTEMFLIEVAAYALSLLHEAAQTAALQNSAVWAEGRHLDDRGASFSTFRLLAQRANLILRFSLTAVRPVNVVVAAGTRVSAGAGLIFLTSADLVIAPGQLSGEVTALAEKTGALANALPAGAVSELLDPVAYVSAVTNISPSAGGTDDEDDDRYRLRVVNALLTIAKTGPRAGYRELVMAVDPEIVDVGVVRPEPGRINIYPLMSNGLPTAAIRNAVLAYLDPETVRPMGDDVHVLSPVRAGFSLNVTVRSLQAVPGLAAAVDAAIRQRFQPWTQTLGSQLAPSALVAAAQAVTGVSAVEVNGLVFTDLGPHQFAGIDSIVINQVVLPDV